MNDVLVVDDVEVLRADFRRLIETAGCAAVEATNEAQAVRLLKDGRFSVVVTDIDLSLAGGSTEGGLIVLEEVKRQTPETEVIVVTSGDLRHSPESVMALGGTFIDRIGPRFHTLFHSTLTGALRRHAAAATSPELVLRLQEDGRMLHFRVVPEQPFEHSISDPLTLDATLAGAVSAAIGTLSNSIWRKEQNVLARWMGGHLWTKVFAEHADLARAFGWATGLAASRNVAIRLVGGASMLDVPFELVHDGQEFLALQQPLVRTIQHGGPSPAAHALPRDTSKWKVLLIAADTWERNLDSIPDVDIEVNKLRAVFERRGVHPVVMNSWDASAASVEEKLKEKHWHVVHFAGHGIYEPDYPSESGWALWERSCTETQWNSIKSNLNSVGPIRGLLKHMTTADLRQLLQPRPPWLGYLSCCHSARTGTGAQAVYSKSLGLMDALIQSGVTVVVGHRWPMLDDSDSVRFVITFYETLIDTGSSKRAILRARQSAQAHEAHWASAVMSLQV